MEKAINIVNKTGAVLSSRTIRARRIVRCDCCGTMANVRWIRARERAGVELQHLACKECGNNTLKEI
jgi:hypothetical protein